MFYGRIDSSVSFLKWIYYGFFYTIFSYASFSYAKESSCQAENFKAFFEQFSESIDMQKQCTLFPLVKLELIETEQDLRPIIQKLDLEKVSFPLILNREERQKQQIQIELQKNNKKKYEVILYQPDTGYRIIYRFIKKNTWKLINMEDWSV